MDEVLWEARNIIDEVDEATLRTFSFPHIWVSSKFFSIKPECSSNVVNSSPSFEVPLLVHRRSKSL
jgi:hypothetical protein